MRQVMEWKEGEILVGQWIQKGFLLESGLSGRTQVIFVIKDLPRYTSEQAEIKQISVDWMQFLVILHKVFHPLL